MRKGARWLTPLASQPVSSGLIERVDHINHTLIEHEQVARMLRSLFRMGEELSLQGGAKSDAGLMRGGKGCTLSRSDSGKGLSPRGS